MSAATLAYDRTLLASARTVAERLVVRDGKLAVDVPMWCSTASSAT